MIVFSAVTGGLVYIYVSETMIREKKIAGLYLCSLLSSMGKTYISIQNTDTVNRFLSDNIRKEFQKMLEMEWIENIAVTRESVGTSDDYEPVLGKPPMVVHESDPSLLEIDKQIYRDITVVEEGRMSGGGDQRVFLLKKTDVLRSTDTITEEINIYAVLSKNGIVQARRKMAIQICIAAFMFALFGYVVAGRLASYVIKPVDELVKDMEVAAQGEFGKKSSTSFAGEMGVLARTFNAMKKALYQKEQDFIDNELTAASDIQARLLPDETPQIEGFKIKPFYRSAKEVGGDYYDFITLDEDHLGIIVADVSGKGINGSLVMSITRSVLRMVSHFSSSPADTLAETNGVIAADMRRGMFVTAFYCVLNTKTNRIVFSSAGHNPMLVYRQDGPKIELANSPGTVLGIIKGSTYEKTIEEKALNLNSGDMIVLYTDGVVEAMDEEGNEYTEERFYKFTLKNGHKPPDEYINDVITEINLHRGRADQSDDITIVAVKVD